MPLARIVGAAALSLLSLGIVASALPEAAFAVKSGKCITPLGDNGLPVGGSFGSTECGKHKRNKYETEQKHLQEKKYIKGIRNQSGEGL